MGATIVSRGVCMQGQFEKVFHIAGGVNKVGGRVPPYGGDVSTSPGGIHHHHVCKAGCRWFSVWRFGRGEVEFFEMLLELVVVVICNYDHRCIGLCFIALWWL